jgi:hypothetical protein
MAISIEAPENRVSDGVICLAPFEFADVVTVMKWDADPSVQHWYDWPLTPPWNDPDTYQARRAHAERVVRSKHGAWDAGEEFAFVIRSAETGEGAERRGVRIDRFLPGRFGSVVCSCRDRT